MQPITAPSGEQQQELLKKVYKQHGVVPASLQYIECHGRYYHCSGLTMPTMFRTKHNNILGVTQDNVFSEVETVLNIISLPHGCSKKRHYM